ncbi:MAG: TM2 domain-containing protein [Acidiferrobacter sp.]
MTNAWKQWDFSGAGLQSLNLELTKRLRKPAVAYGLWMGFALGLHAFYLHERRRGLAYLAASLTLGVLALLAPWPAPAGFGALYLALAVADLATLERRLTTYNKTLRLDLSLRKGTTPPAGFRGRYTDQDVDIRDYVAVKERERAGHATETPPLDSNGRPQSKSFQEQEAALRAYTERRKSLKNPRS